MIINGVSACWSGLKYHDAIEKLHLGTLEPMFGVLATDDVQLCPQHPQPIDEALIDSLMAHYPTIRFRLHSDVRTRRKSGFTMDLVDVTPENMWYFQDLAQLSSRLKAPAYSLHAGKRNDEPLAQLWDKLHRLQDLFDCPVAVEGHYPFKMNHWFLNSWQEYEAMLESGVSYALDLSHLNIVAKRQGWQADLTQALIASSQCIEIHLSFNEGMMDNHLIGKDNYQALWTRWQAWLANKPQDCVLFSEGNQVLEARLQEKALSQ